MRFSSSTNKDIDRWVDKGLIDCGTAEKLNDELVGQNIGIGIGGLLAILGALLLGASVLTLVAANWQEFPRIGRVALIILLIWGCFFVGAWRESRGDAASAQGAYLLGAISFGGGIALIGQMYQLSGDAASAALVWALDILAAAILLRSGVLTATTGGLGLWYLF